MSYSLYFIVKTEKSESPVLEKWLSNTCYLHKVEYHIATKIFMMV